uniref:Uncharacterized protein n=1 Tax=Daphnia magna TaxID=35525 RepID=A0A0P5X7B4_9CRUS
MQKRWLYPSSTFRRIGQQSLLFEQGYTKNAELTTTNLNRNPNLRHHPMYPCYLDTQVAVGD